MSCSKKRGVVAVSHFSDLVCINSGGSRALAVGVLNRSSCGDGRFRNEEQKQSSSDPLTCGAAKNVRFIAVCKVWLVVRWVYSSIYLCIQMTGSMLQSLQRAIPGLLIPCGRAGRSRPCLSGCPPVSQSSEKHVYRSIDRYARANSIILSFILPVKASKSVTATILFHPAPS